MKLPLAGIIASYVAIAVLLLSLNLASRWHWGVKATAIAIAAVFFGVSYVSITGLIGWPSEARVPEHFQLHWATVVEPDKLNGLPGSIFLWVEALDENNMLAGTPRAFRVPYSRELADRIGRAKERIEQGTDQAGTARDLGRTRIAASPVRRRARMSRAVRAIPPRLSSTCPRSNSKTCLCRHCRQIRRFEGAPTWQSSTAGRSLGPRSAFRSTVPAGQNWQPYAPAGSDAEAVYKYSSSLRPFSAQTCWPLRPAIGGWNSNERIGACRERETEVGFASDSPVGTRREGPHSRPCRRRCRCRGQRIRSGTASPSSQ
jgi:hypothetical protein